MKLVEAFDKYNCDKGSIKHRYDRVYEPALEHIKTVEFSLLEIGVYKGVSVEAWIDYFPKVHVTGVDTFQRVDPGKIPILNHERVTWRKGDSTIPMHWDTEFDVIIDDGLHTHEAQRKTFENFIPYLKDTGVYFIEDVWPFDLMTNQEKQHPWLRKHPNDWNDAAYDNLLKTISPHKVTFHDIRRGYEPDTFIIEIRK